MRVLQSEPSSLLIYSSTPSPTNRCLDKIHDDERGRGSLDVQLGSSPMTAFSVVLGSISIKSRYCSLHALEFLCPFLGGTIGESACEHTFTKGGGYNIHISAPVLLASLCELLLDAECLMRRLIQRQAQHINIKTGSSPLCCWPIQSMSCNTERAKG